MISFEHGRPPGFHCGLKNKKKDEYHVLPMGYSSVSGSFGFGFFFAIVSPSGQFPALFGRMAVAT